MKAVILAGGTGTGLWPVSRIYNPKQFVKLKGESESFFQKTVQKCTKIINHNDIFVVTNQEYKYFVLGQLEEMSLNIPEENVILEPSFKNTLHAVSMGVFELLKKNNQDLKDLLIIPSNGVISDFDAIFSHADIFADGSLGADMLTFGIKPVGAYTGYGYIKLGEEHPNCFKVEKFAEKPSETEAKNLVAEGCMYNLGVLYFNVATFLEELERHQPKLHNLLCSGDVEGAYNLPVTATIERGLLEKSNKLSVIPLEEQWDNADMFSGFYRQYKDDKDAEGNITFNDNVFINAKNNLVYAEGEKVVSVIGCDNLTVIDQPDALLVCASSQTEKVREVASVLKERKDPRAEYHTTCYRPWGSYTVLEEGAGYKIKRITVLQGKKLSYQMHYHRSEHWVVAKGTALVVKEGKEHIVRSGESIFLSVGEKHRLENPGKALLEVIEVQIGPYLGEDDIVRFEDDFGR